MSWLFSQALVEEYLGDISLDGEQSVPSSGNPIPQAYCAPGKMTEFSRLSRFGMTFKPLTDTLGKELLTLFRGVFPARIFQPLEKGRESMESDQECGEKWRGSFTKYDPDSSLWKTHQCSLLGDLDEFSETWPQWGLMRDGECWEQRTLEQTIRGTESGLLEQTWPTPRSCSAMAATITPKSAWNEKRNANLETIVGRVQFPTPTAHNSKEGNYPSERNRKTPTLATHAGGKLNPMWVEWLMGWPLGWTDLKPLATDKYHCVQLQHGES